MQDENFTIKINGLEYEKFENPSMRCPKTNEKIGKDWADCACLRVEEKMRGEGEKRTLPLVRRDLKYEICEYGYAIVDKEIVGCACRYRASQKK